MHRRSRPRWRWRPRGATRRSLNLPSITKFIRTRLPSGRSDFWRMRRKYTARIGNRIKGQSLKIFMPRLDNCRWRTIFYQARSVASAMRAQRDDRQDGCTSREPAMRDSGAFPIRHLLYLIPVPIRARDRELMRQIDEIHLDYPFYDSRKICNELWAKGYDIGCERVRRLMRRMDIETLYVKPRLSLAHLGHVKYPSDRIMDRAHPGFHEICFIPFREGLFRFHIFSIQTKSSNRGAAPMHQSSLGRRCGC